MVKEGIILFIAIIASILIGMLWRSEEVHKLEGTIQLQQNMITQTQSYLSQFDFNDGAIKNWHQLGYTLTKHTVHQDTTNR